MHLVTAQRAERAVFHIQPRAIANELTSTHQADESLIPPGCFAVLVDRLSPASGALD